MNHLRSEVGDALSGSGRLTAYGTRSTTVLHSHVSNYKAIWSVMNMGRSGVYNRCLSCSYTTLKTFFTNFHVLQLNIATFVCPLLLLLHVITF
jgi:hypothetical protein